MMLIKITGESVKFIGSKYIQESLINTTPARPDDFLFLQESQAKVLTSQSTHLFQNKNKRPRCIKVGNGPLKYSLCEKYLQLSADHHAEWPLCKLWTLCFSVLDLVYPQKWKKHCIPYTDRKWPMDSKLKIIIYCLSWWTSHLRPHSGNDFLFFSLIICFFCCQSQIVVGLVVSESRVPSLYFPGGIFTR